jgi:hypothetical protein
VVKVVGAGGVRREGLAACGGDAKTEAEKTWIGCNRSGRPRSRERMRGSAGKATGGKADPSGSCGRVSGEASEGGLTRGAEKKKRKKFYFHSASEGGLTRGAEKKKAKEVLLSFFLEVEVKKCVLFMDF